MIRTTKTLVSTIDQSVNFVHEGDFPGFLESRYVHRSGKSYFTCYLSTQSGCKQACRFCHLTTTKQTDAQDATTGEIQAQARAVLEYHDHRAFGGAYKVSAVHYSFMARGEPLASEEFLQHGDKGMNDLAREAIVRGLLPRFMVSTIMPRSLKESLRPYGGSLAHVFRVMQPHIYYSIYSTDDAFRKKWLPNAMPVTGALEILKDYQDQTGRIVKLHWALIAGENDWLPNWNAIGDAVDRVGLRVDVNLVRYNPWSAEQGKEAHSNNYDWCVSQLRQRWPKARVKIVDRVGFDVKASCGMFVGGDS